MNCPGSRPMSELGLAICRRWLGLKTAAWDAGDEARASQAPMGTAGSRAIVLEVVIVVRLGRGLLPAHC